MQSRKQIKVKVAADGDIAADGQRVTVEQLAIKFADLKATRGEVWYHRENPADEPHANALKVMELVAEHGLPIRLSAMPDFSDTVDDKGVSDRGVP
ncbi:MAG: hypothetical protein K1X74_13415 [Pirellulales bacterium]|nr:hypothetical protein [Pirellulales bacterium]